MLLLTVLDTVGQEITVVKMTQTTSVQALTRRRDDPKGEACALLKVQFPIQHADFDGNIVGDVAFKTNEYWVYMPEGSAELTVSYRDFPAKTIAFRDYGIEKLESKVTYELTLLGKRKDAPQLYNFGLIALAENDVAKAYCCFAKAAQDEYPYAFYNLAELYLKPGTDAEPIFRESLQEAYKYLKRAASFDIPEAQYRFGQLLLNSQKQKYGSTLKLEDASESSADYAWAFINKAAARGVPEAISALAAHNDNNAGGGSLNEQSIQLMENEAQKGNTKYLYNLAEYYIKNKFANKGEVWLSKLINQEETGKYDDINRQIFLLGQLFERKRENDKAIYWYQRGDERGDVKSQYCLGKMYYDGQNIRRDYAKAYELFQKASCQTDNFSSLMRCLGYRGNGEGFVSSSENDDDRYRLMSLVALGYMFRDGKGMTADQDQSKRLFWFSSTDIGKNEIGLFFYKKREYKHAFQMLNIPALPRDCIIDPLLIGKVHFAIGMGYYWGLEKSESVDQAKYYFKKAAQMGDTRARKVVDAMCIANVNSLGIITSKRASLGKICGDGAILNRKGTIIGNIDPKGVMYDVSNVKQGHVDANGDIYNRFEKVGRVDAQGQVYNLEGKVIGQLNGGPVRNALLYFFFDEIDHTKWMEFKPAMQ